MNANTLKTIVLGVASVATAIMGLSALNKYDTKKSRSKAKTSTKSAFVLDCDVSERRYVKRACKVSLSKRNVSISHHWALTFDWGDYKATYEALQDDSGRLIPSWRQGNPVDGTEDVRFEWHVVKTFDIVCSPEEVNRMAFEIPYNGAKYILTKVNCHFWIKLLGSELGIKYFDEEFTSIESIIPYPLPLIADTIGSSGSRLGNAGSSQMTPGSKQAMSVSSQLISGNSQESPGGKLALSGSNQVMTGSNKAMPGSVKVVTGMTQIVAGSDQVTAANPVEGVALVTSGSRQVMAGCNEVMKHKDEILGGCSQVTSGLSMMMADDNIRHHNGDPKHHVD